MGNRKSRNQSNFIQKFSAQSMQYFKSVRKNNYLKSAFEIIG